MGSALDSSSLPITRQKAIMKRLTKVQSAGICLSTVGIIGLLPLQYIRMQNQHALANAPTISVPTVATQPASQAISGHPTQIVIPSLNISLQVMDGAYNSQTGEWTLTDRATHYALPSTLPNDTSGNTLIYGHYNKHVFAKLHTIKPGAEAQVITEEGYRFIYTFTSAEALNPADTSIFLYDGPSQLTLQTCSGSLMQNRQLHYFTFDRVEKL